MTENPYRSPDEVLCHPGIFEGEITTRDVWRHTSDLKIGFVLCALALFWFYYRIAAGEPGWDTIFYLPLPFATLFSGGYLIKRYFRRLANGQAYAGHIRGRITEEWLELETGGIVCRVSRAKATISVAEDKACLQILDTLFVLPHRLFSDFAKSSQFIAQIQKKTQTRSAASAVH